MATKAPLDALMIWAHKHLPATETAAWACASSENLRADIMWLLGNEPEWLAVE
jgi:hypothetical protein